MELAYLTIHAAHELIRQRRVSPVELAEACLRRIEDLDPSINSFITVNVDLALEAARQAEKALIRRLDRSTSIPRLMGIPIALKDLYETRNVLTTAGSTFFKDYIPKEDAEPVKRLKRRGAVVLGKLNMHEIALGVTNANPHFGACRNPWDINRISGGSSGGSGAALAAGFCLGSLGTDSGGSIRIPASLCGVVGLKPTYGRVSLRGVIPLSWNTDHAGPMARCVMDTAIMLQAIAGYDPRDPYSIRKPAENYLSKISDGIKDWRIAFVDDSYLDKSDSEVAKTVQATTDVFRDLGAKMYPVEFPGLYQAAQANSLMVPSDAAAFHQERLQEKPEGFGKDILRRLHEGAARSSTEYILARRKQTVLRWQFETFFVDYDILILPTTPVAAPLIEGPDALEQARLLTRYTAPFNLTGLPAVSLPCGFTSQGLPIGLQLVAKPWAEAGLLRAAFAYEQATQWNQRRPAFEKA